MSHDETKQLAISSESHARIFAFLQGQQSGVLATVDPNQNPHAVVIYYSIDEDFTVYFATKRETKKSDNLSHNNHAMLLVYEEQEQITVQVTGECQDISDTPASREVYKQMVEASMKTSESGIPPISKLSAGDYIAYRLDPVRIRMAVFNRPDSGGYEMYETINF